MSIKKYIYKLDDFSGARLKYEKSELDNYKKIKVDGFIIHEESNYYIIFSVDNQLVRRLKLSSINCNIKTLSVEDRILRLLDISKEFETEKTTPFGYNYSTSFYSYNNVDYNEGIYILKEERKAQKQYQKYQSKQFSQMTNRFSKKGFKK